ncbi:MAG: exosortase/archaeosortase family protein [Planctomycetota bacterium]
MSASTATSGSGGLAGPAGGDGSGPGLLLGMLTRSGAVWCSVLGVAFLAVFYRWVFRQGEISITKLEDWGHALVIPIISGYLLWKQRHVIARTSTSVFWPASVVFVLGIVSYVYCLINIQNHMLQGASLVLALGGLVLWLTGPQMLRPVFLPIAYLLLAVTIAESIMLSVTFKLQIIASQGAWIMLNLIGQPFGWFSADATGNVIEIITSGGEILPMNVAEACSGMRMVVAFYALAGAVALLGTAQWWQRIALMLLAGPVAVLMNMVRVTVLGLLMLIDPDLAAGDAHMVIGTILLFPSLLLFMGIVWALNKVIEPEAESAAGGPTGSQA